MPGTRGAQPQNVNAMSHGLHHARSVLLELGCNPLDGRSAVSQALREYQNELISDLGGAVSTAQHVLIDLVSRQRILLDSIDAWLFRRSPLSTDGEGEPNLLPVVRQREVIASNLAKYLAMLGLERKAKPVPTLQQYVTEKYGGAEASK